MAQVRAKTLCFIDNGLRNEGDVFEYNGVFNKNLEYLDGAPDEAEDTEQKQEATAKKWSPKAKRASAE